MDLVRERIAETNKLLEKYPEHKSSIIDLYQLMEEEIADGESPSGEWEKFVRDVSQLTNN